MECPQELIMHACAVNIATEADRWHHPILSGGCVKTIQSSVHQTCFFHAHGRIVVTPQAHTSKFKHEFTANIDTRHYNEKKMQCRATKIIVIRTASIASRNILNENNISYTILVNCFSAKLL